MEERNRRYFIIVFPRVEVVVKNHLLNELFRIIYKCIIIVFDTFLMILFKMQN